jgi:hypothetical protein
MDDLERKSWPKTSGSSGVVIHFDWIGATERASNKAMHLTVRFAARM